jgi:UDP-N-acetylmuramate dehydrogenase
MEVQTNVPLAPYTTLHIGGLARYFTVVTTEAELAQACNWCKQESLELFTLGGGSNVLISDSGYDGLVMLMAIKGRAYTPSTHQGQVLADIKAGESWDDFVCEAVTKGYVGMECLSGIPGKVGGSVVQNIGAYGQEVCEIVEQVTCYDTDRGEFSDYPTTACHFGYRQSSFKTDASKIVVSARFRLRVATESVVSYQELAAKFGSGKPTPAQVRQAVLALRKAKGMVVDSTDPNSVSAGSFFMNPFVPNTIFDTIKQTYPDVPHWPQPGGMTKLSAGWLIEKAGLPKGFIYQTGKVGLSQKHALAIINRGDAQASDVLALSELIKTSVFASFGVKLQPEVVCVGF